MKRTQFLAATALMAVLAAATLALAGCTGSSQSDKSAQSADPPDQKEEKTVQYTCSMHPEVVQDKPGNCPKCGMKLVEKR